MGRNSNIIDGMLLATCIGYFILRIIYIAGHNVIFDKISIVLSIIVGVSMLLISLILFFNRKKKKEAIRPFLIAMALICVNFVS